MPKDHYVGLKGKQKAAGRTREGQTNYTAARDKSVDAWIAHREAQIAAGVKVKKNKHHKRKKKKGPQP